MPPATNPVDSTFLDALARRVVVADGAMGTMLQAADLVLDDFAGLEGCNEILNDTRPDVVRSIHRAYFEAGADAVETNTFGANLPNLAEYGIADRIRELAEKGAQLARDVADELATPARPRRRRLDRRDLPGPAAGQGGGARDEAGDGRGRQACPADHLGDRGDDRHHAAGQRDRRGAPRGRAAGRRP